MAQPVSGLLSMAKLTGSPSWEKSAAAPTEHMKVIERLHRVDDHTLLYRFTVDDPTSYTKPWSGEVPMLRMDEQIYEYACHEGNYALPDILRGARYQEKQTPR